MSEKTLEIDRSHRLLRELLCRAPGQALYLCSNLSLCDPDFICRLQIEPELRSSAEPMGQPQRRVAADRAFPAQDLADTVRRHLKLAGQLGSVQSNLVQLIRQNFTRVYRRSRHVLCS